MPPPLGWKPSKDTLFRMEWYKSMPSWWPTRPYRTWSLGPSGLFCSPRITLFYTFFGLPWWLRWKRICLQCRRPEFDPWVRKIPSRRKWLPTPILLPREFHGQRSLASHSPWDRKRVGHDWMTNTSLFKAWFSDFVGENTSMKIPTFLKAKKL